MQTPNQLLSNIPQPPKNLDHLVTKAIQKERIKKGVKISVFLAVLVTTFSIFIPLKQNSFENIAKTNEYSPVDSGLIEIHNYIMGNKVDEEIEQYAIVDLTGF